MQLHWFHHMNSNDLTDYPATAYPDNQKLYNCVFICATAFPPLQAGNSYKGWRHDNCVSSVTSWRCDNLIPSPTLRYIKCVIHMLWRIKWVNPGASFVPVHSCLKNKMATPQKNLWSNHELGWSLICWSYWFLFAGIYSGQPLKWQWKTGLSHDTWSSVLSENCIHQ